MSLLCENETKDSFDFDADVLGSEILSCAVRHERKLYKRPVRTKLLKTDADVNLLITDAVEMRRLNKEFRGIDSVTDVISFPTITLSAQTVARRNDGACYWVNDWVCQREFGAYDEQSNTAVLGDIAVCGEKLHLQAKDYGHSVRRELAFLCAHGILHLLGYDHIEKADEEQMMRKQRAILEELGISREP